MNFISNFILKFKKEEVDSSEFPLTRKQKRQIKAQFDLRSLRPGPSKARGGFGVIAIGIARKGEQKYAVKLIEPRYGDGAYSATNWTREVREEAEFLATLRHENIVEFFDSHMLYGSTKCMKVAKLPRFFALKCELLDGDIRSLFSGSRSECEERRFRQFARQIGGAIEFMHSRRVVHHDIKPINILYKRLPDERLIFKLIDFGLAKSYDEPIPPQSPLEYSHFIGTRVYLCQQKAMQIAYNPYLSDVYSFGMTLAECKIGFGFAIWCRFGSDYKRELISQKEQIGSDIPYFETICDMLSNDESDRPYIGDVLHLFD